ncbi:hypothetical protein Tcan_16708 [Toxocara canis]|uniref:Uncharacterized protein n=1 Tax=Toxocara canis TaxID=6265 RepID=A0A0B2VH05_TOXCA|nr:hypothetical protein Tcan_16708 [Toxocara canis]
MFSDRGVDHQQDGKIRCDVYMALPGCGELRIAIDGKFANCNDRESDEIDEIAAVHDIQGKELFYESEMFSDRGVDHQQDGKIRCDVYMALPGCGELRIAIDGKFANCNDRESDEIDEIAAVHDIQGKELFYE